ncbi:MAG: hypothetical protein RLZZ306_2376 [Bacteroidota bacterium]
MTARTQQSTTYRAYDEIIDFITSSPDPKEVLNFRPPTSVINRVEDLLYKKKTSELNNEENTELDRFMLIEHIMIMSKKRAKKRLVL